MSHARKEWRDAVKATNGNQAEQPSVKRIIVKRTYIPGKQTGLEVDCAGLTRPEVVRCLRAVADGLERQHAADVAAAEAKAGAEIHAADIPHVVPESVTLRPENTNGNPQAEA